MDKFPLVGDGITLDLPPLDVLMVWHSHMLNPRIYLEDCIRFTKHSLWHTPFPWQRIYESIDDESLEYTQQDVSIFQEKTKHPWNPLEENDRKDIVCPMCSMSQSVPWTTVPSLSSLQAVKSYLSNDTGFTGHDFHALCMKCDYTITHESLRVGKFMADADSLLHQSRPLPGTILNIWGEPQCSAPGKNLGSHDPFFPNRAIQTRPDLRPAALRDQLRPFTIDRLKTVFGKTMNSTFELMYINASQNKPDFVAKNSRIAVRKMFSHYWNNSSIFGIELVGAVLRQGTFVQKMKKLDWLHSPGVMTTAQRLIVKYHRFILLAADAPKKTVVPTLDVDLAWVSMTRP